MLKDEIKKDFQFDKGGLRTKCLRKDSTAEEGLVAEKLQHISHEESCQHSSARSGGAAKSLKSPAIQPGSCTPSRFPTTFTSFYGQGIIVAPVVDFRFLVCPPAPSKFLTSTPKRHGGDTVSSRKPSEPSTGVAADTSVKLTIEYPSKTVNKTLEKDYEAIGKALAYGPPQRVATAVVKCKVLTKYVEENVLKTLQKGAVNPGWDHLNYKLRNKLFILCHIRLVFCSCYPSLNTELTGEFTCIAKSVGFSCWYQEAIQVCVIHKNIMQLNCYY